MPHSHDYHEPAEEVGATAVTRLPQTNGTAEAITPPRRGLLWLSCLGNITMGASATGLGSAWPAIRGDFGQGLSAIQVPLLLFAIGTVVPTLFASRLLRLLGVGVLVLTCTLMQAVSQFGAGCTASWWMFGAMFLLLGTGTGVMDATIKVVVTRRYTNRHLNLVHASWSVGAWIGAGLISMMMTLGYSWRVGFGSVGILLLVPSILFFVFLKVWRTEKDLFKVTLKPENSHRVGDSINQKQTSLLVSLKCLPVFGYVINLILLYIITYNIGMLASSVMVQEYYWDEAAAARLVIWYWGALVPSRLLLGMVADRISNLTMIVMGCAGVMLGSALLWFGGYGAPSVSTLGVLFIGFSTGPIISALTFGTTRRVATAHLVNVNALQVIVANSCWVCLPVLTAYSLGDGRLTWLWPMAGTAAVLMAVFSAAGRFMRKPL